VAEDGLAIRRLEEGELPTAARLVAYAMRDNPLHIAALGHNPHRRTRVLRRLFAALLADPARQVHGAYRGGALIGVIAYTQGGRCLPSWRQWRAFFPVAWAAGMRLPWLARWLWAWWRADPKESHSHLGPVAVAPTHQGAGVGTELLRAHVSQLDACEVPGYLETDSEANVRFYAACGFITVRKRRVLGVQNWFMTRPCCRQSRR